MAPPRSAAISVAGVASRQNRSVADIIEDFRVGDDEALIDLIEELEQEDIDAVGFRYHAASTQNRQDRHLTVYRNFIKMIKKMPDTASDDEVDIIGFPMNPESPNLAKQQRLFLAFVMRVSRPRSKIIGNATWINYTTLASYRDSLLYWTFRTYHLRDSNPPNRGKLFYQLVEAMRAAFKRHGSKVKQGTIRMGLGLAELRQLIDWEMSTAYCIENSEQHQILWLIGRVTALRPGSLLTTKHRKDCLKWGDIKFSQGDEPGKFSAIIQIRNFKTNPDDPERSIKLPHKKLSMNIRSPSNEKIIFSIPLRLLVIALRRNLLVGITSVDELMTTNMQNIMIKPENYEDPVFYRAGHRGLSLDEPHPLTANNASEFLTHRGYALGYEHRISFYDLRKRAATDMVRRVGADRTREILAHEPGTSTLERYYLNIWPTTDLTAIGLDEPIGPQGQSSEMAANYAPLAHNKLSGERLQRLRGIALNALARKMMEADENYPVDADERELKLYERRMRRVAAHAVRQEEHAAQEAQMTKEDYDARVQAAKASEFAAAVMQTARDMMTNEATVEASAEEDDADLDEDFEEDFEDPAEEDLEQRHSGEDDTVLQLFVDEEEVAIAEEGVLTIPYEVQARALMETLLENRLSAHVQWADREDKSCPLCNGDDTTTDEQKAKQWESQAKLNSHMDSLYHSPYRQWRRRLVQRHAEEDPNGPWSCPYCKETGITETVYTAPETVINHINNSTAENTSLAHDQLKEAEGWYEPGFAGTISREHTKRKIGDFKKRMSIEGIELEHDPELPWTMRHPDIPGIMLGNFDDLDTIPAKLQGVVSAGTAGDLVGERIPRHLAGLVRETDSMMTVADEAIPDHLTGLVKETAHIQTAVPTKFKGTLKHSAKRGGPGGSTG